MARAGGVCSVRRKRQEIPSRFRIGRRHRRAPPCASNNHRSRPRATERASGIVRSDGRRELGHLRSAWDGDRACLSHEPHPQHRGRRARHLHRLSGRDCDRASGCLSRLPFRPEWRAAVALGLAIFWFTIRRVMGEPPYVGLMLTVGIATILNGLMIVLFGGGMTASRPGCRRSPPSARFACRRRTSSPRSAPGCRLRRSPSSIGLPILVCRCARWPSA